MATPSTPSDLHRHVLLLAPGSTQPGDVACFCSQSNGAFGDPPRFECAARFPARVSDSFALDWQQYLPATPRALDASTWQLAECRHWGLHRPLDRTLYDGSRERHDAPNGVDNPHSTDLPCIRHDH